MKELVIVGSGPAALSAAIYAARDGVDTTVYEKTNFGGQVATIDQIDNFPGFPEGISGVELSRRMREQAERFGAKLEYGEVTKLAVGGDKKTLTVDGEKVETKAVLLATGWTYNKLGVPGEDEYKGKGVHYCATCDGAFYEGKKIAVVGGANSAVQEAVFLTRFAAGPVEIFARSQVRAEKILQEKLQDYVAKGEITVHEQAVTEEIVGENGHVTGLKVNGEVVPVDGVFIFAGIHPASEFLKDSGVELDKFGYIQADDSLQTSLPGVFLAGDIRAGSTKQVVAAAGEGATAARAINRYLMSN
ncbi:MAG: FAD-dependent oxidoreductase [Candidatus Nomurabacteria bacterium]|nr:FAD-dependent oxidoreductase [Candidatus Nomurabacteria bacterium]